jgi:hypothetical protein
MSRAAEVMVMRLVDAIPALLLCAAIPAQGRLPAPGRSGMPQPLPGTPVVAPAVPQPALALQPGMDDPEQTRSASSPGTAGPSGRTNKVPTPAEKKAKEFFDLRIAGDELRKRIEAVLKGLPWQENLLDASAKAAATGKPILWVEALGEVDGLT